MKICLQNSPNFQRRLKSSEEAEYSDVLKRGKAKASGTSGEGRSILILHAPSLPQSQENNTGVGNLASSDSAKFFDFAKKYWGINEVQILPIGQYSLRHGRYNPYGGTSTDLGNHVINLEDFLTKEELKQVVDANKVQDRVNFANIVESDSVSEKLLKDVYKRISPELKQEFEQYKTEMADVLDRKALYNALTELNGSNYYKHWNDTDQNLFDENIVNIDVRERRINEIKKLKSEIIEFYKFKNFLAEKSLQKAKERLNSKGIKLNGDILCGFSNDEIWAHPKAFVKDLRMKEWNFPILDKNSSEAELVLREKIRMYAKRFDGFRVDASWTYIAPNVINTVTKSECKIENGEFFLNIIDDEVKKVKGADFNLNNITHEFAANPYTEFNIFSSGGCLKPPIINRVRIHTSEHLSNTWGSADNFLERRWPVDKFIIGATNHDSMPMSPTEKQINALARILKIKPEKLKENSEFIKAKFSEPMRAKNNMFFFLNALGIHEKFKNNDDRALDWARMTPENYEEVYFDSLHKGIAFNPMDALEKQFIAQGLDKEEPELFKKIVKYRKILEKKESTSFGLKTAAIVSAIAILGFCAYKYINGTNTNNKNDSTTVL